MGVVASPSQYATATDLAQIGALPAFVQSLSSAQVTEALQTASSIMDGYFASRFTLPILTWTYDVVQWCCVIAVYHLAASRGLNPNNPAELIYQDRYDRAMKWLKDVANNQATPQMTDSSTGAQPGFPAPAASPNTVSPTTGTPFAGQTWNTWARR